MKTIPVITSNIFKEFEWNRFDVIVVDSTVNNPFGDIGNTDTNKFHHCINKTTNNNQFIYFVDNLYQSEVIVFITNLIIQNTNNMFDIIGKSKIHVGIDVGYNKKQFQNIPIDYNWINNNVTNSNKFKFTLVEYHEEVNEIIDDFHDEQYNFMSNMYYLSNPIQLDGYKYHSVEAAYMAAKVDYFNLNSCKTNNGYKLFKDELKNINSTLTNFSSIEEMIHYWKLLCANPKQLGGIGKIKSLSRYLIIDTEEWDKVSLRIMMNLVELKFKNNPLLANKLKSTNHKLLVEGNYWKDTKWGVYKKNGLGQNLLGRLLMYVRSNL